VGVTAPPVGSGRLAGPEDGALEDSTTAELTSAVPATVFAQAETSRTAEHIARVRKGCFIPAA